MKAVEKYESIDTGKGYDKRSGMKRYMASCCFEGALPGKTGCQVSSETFHIETIDPRAVSCTLFCLDGTCGPASASTPTTHGKDLLFYLCVGRIS